MLGRPYRRIDSKLQKSRQKAQANAREKKQHVETPILNGCAVCGRTERLSVIYLDRTLYLCGVHHAAVVRQVKQYIDKSKEKFGELGELVDEGI